MDHQQPRLILCWSYKKYHIYGSIIAKFTSDNTHITTFVYYKRKIIKNIMKIKHIKSYRTELVKIQNYEFIKQSMHLKVSV